MIEKIAAIIKGAPYPIPNSAKDITEKLNYYRSLFGKTHDLSDNEFENLKKDIKTFFNVKAIHRIINPPPQIVRISNNNSILDSKGKDLYYLTEISELLAPPLKACKYGRCNLSEQQVLYCSTSEAAAYWETKPKKGDVITISRFELKPSTTINCWVIKKEKTASPKIEHQLQEMYYLIEEFCVEAFSLEVSKLRPRDYIFSALVSSELLFSLSSLKDIFHGIIYPSVQKKKYDENFAILNDVIFDYYNLIAVETRFILDEFENIDPSTDELITDNLIGSFGTTTFDFMQGKIIYNNDAEKLFKLFREMQTSSGTQIRYNVPEGVPKNIAFNCSGNLMSQPLPPPIKLSPNSRINVVYQNGTRKKNIRFKFVKSDMDKGLCAIDWNIY